MIKMVSVQNIRAIEEAVDKDLMPFARMMDHAGHAIAIRAQAIVTELDAPRVMILVGEGNNGGDGLVAAKYLAEENKNFEVRLYLLNKPDDEDSNFKAVQDLGLFVAYAPDDKDHRVLKNMVASSDLVIDALFGIGIRLPLRDEPARILRSVNQVINALKAEKPEQQIISPAHHFAPVKPHIPKVLAVDCPSGVDCDSGEADSNTVHADETITFIAAKTGLIRFPAAQFVGKLTVASLGIPDDFKAMKEHFHLLADANLIKRYLPERGDDSNKGTYGKVMVVAGSVNYSGAPSLSAVAAYRAGAGLVSVAVPYAIVNTVAARHMEQTFVALPHDIGVISHNAVPVLLEHLEGYNALLIGPGMGTEETTSKFLEQLLQTNTQNKKTTTQKRMGFQLQHEDEQNEEPSEARALPPIVIDADGLNLLAKMNEWWKLLPSSTIITPHPGEMGRLCGINAKEVQANRWELIQEKSQEWDLHIVLKGAHTLIANPKGKITALPFKNDALATAGTGDVLAGIITGLVAQNIEPYEAAICGGYIHGLAGEIATLQQGNRRSVIASDVLESIGDTYATIEQA